jgi:hypothetical protein
MEDNELNEEVLGDVDNPPAEGAPQEGAEEPSGMMDNAMQERIDNLENRISELQSSIAIIIEAGATIMEPASTDEDSEDDEEPYLYLEDLNYDM